MYGGFAGSFGILPVPPLGLRQIELLKDPAPVLDLSQSFFICACHTRSSCPVAASWAALARPATSSIFRELWAPVEGRVVNVSLNWRFGQ